MLGDTTRFGTAQLPIDRWMLDRLHNRHGAQAMPPVAWHGRFTTPSDTNDAADVVATSREAEPQPSPAPHAAPVAQVAPAGDRDQQRQADDLSLAPHEAQPAKPVVDPLGLDRYTAAATPGGEKPPWVPKPRHTLPTDVTPLHRDELDPDVRALVDELYRQARAEIASERDTGHPAPLQPETRPPAVDDDKPRWEHFDFS